MCHDPSQLSKPEVTQSLVITEDTWRRLVETEDRYLKRRAIYICKENEVERRRAAL